MSASLNPRPSTQEGDLLSRSIKRIKGGDYPAIDEDYQMIENSTQPLSYKDLVLRNDSIEICCDAATNLDILEEDSDCEDDGSIPTILISREEKKRIRSPWLNSIIIKAFGTKSAGYNFIYPRIKAQWKPRGRMDCVDLGVDFFLIRFQEREDLLRVLNGGPWFVGSYYLTIRQWEPAFDPEKAAFTTTAIWARLPRLPIEYYDVKILERIGKLLGKPLRLDAHTAHQTRGQFVRICVQVDLVEPLVPFVMIGKHIQKVLYEGPVALCFSCGCVGHKENSCPLKLSQAPAVMEEDSPNCTKPVNEDAKDDTVIEECQGFGPWMLVDRRKNRRKLNGKAPGSGNQQSNLNSSHGGKLSSQLTESRSGSKRRDEMVNTLGNNPINDPTVGTNGSINTNGPLNHSQNQGPNLSANQISSNVTTSSHTNSISFMVQDPHGLPRDNAKGKDISITCSKGTRKEDKSKKISAGGHPKDVNNLQSSSPSTIGSLGNGSKDLREAVPTVGHLFSQRREQHFANGESIVTASAKGINTGGRLGSRHSSQELDPSGCGSRRSRSHPVSSTPNRMDSTSPSIGSPRHVSHLESDMELDRGETRVGVLGGTTLTSDSVGSGEQLVSQQNVATGKHEDRPLDYSTGGSSMCHESSLHSEDYSVLLPR
ncbi:hypothetical protein SLEP1_g59960, partial [Rubroshorea leprosula]